MDITGGLTATGGGLDVTTNGAEVTGGLTIHSSGLTSAAKVTTYGLVLPVGSVSISAGRTFAYQSKHFKNNLLNLFYV